jgi:integrase
MNSISVTKRERRRTLKSGAVVEQIRYVVNYRDPRTGQRKQLFFDRAKDAQAKRNEIAAQVETRTYSTERKPITVAEAVERWLKDREGQVKPGTLRGYRETTAIITGPLLIGTRRQRAEYTVTGEKPEGSRLEPMLGGIRIQELTTGEIRAWHRTVTTEVGAYAANRARMLLGTVLALAGEDMNIRPPAMPVNLGRGRQRSKKPILTSEQVAVLLPAARADRERGIYVAFPFLAGTRPSEQLGLLWDDVDFDANVIHVCRMQERDGFITDLTKTVAGTRDIPMCSMLRGMLLEWRLVCPRREGQLHRVFPSPGRLAPWPQPRIGGGGPLRYHNFFHRYWTPMLKRLGLPHVTPHSARHYFISTLQAQGLEPGLVAKIAGHANPAVTLAVYTQAVRSPENAVEAMERAFGA